jgi:hypothetical protein
LHATSRTQNLISFRFTSFFSYLDGRDTQACSSTAYLSWM